MAGGVLAADTYTVALPRHQNAFADVYGQRVYSVGDGLPRGDCRVTSVVALKESAGRIDTEGSSKIDVASLEAQVADRWLRICPALASAAGHALSTAADLSAGEPFPPTRRLLERSRCASRPTTEAASRRVDGRFRSKVMCSDAGEARTER